MTAVLTPQALAISLMVMGDPLYRNGCENVSDIGTGNVSETQFPMRIITILQRKVNRKCAATAIFGKRHKRKESEL